MSTILRFFCYFSFPNLILSKIYSRSILLPFFAEISLFSAKKSPIFFFPSFSSILKIGGDLPCKKVLDRIFQAEFGHEFLREFFLLRKFDPLFWPVGVHNYDNDKDYWSNHGDFYRRVCRVWTARFHPFLLPIRLYSMLIIYSLALL